MSTPKVSVVIPSYNRAEYIAATLDSVLAQTYTDFEIIFVDDGSADSTKTILEKYCKRDSRVKYIYQNNSERAIARNAGMKQAQGDYICLVDSDDIWYPHKLERQIKVMEANPEAGFSYAAVNRIDFSGKHIQVAPRQQEGYSGRVFDKLLMRNFIPSVTPMFRRELFDQAGAQRTEFIPYEDWDFWLRLAKLTEFIHIKEPLGDYRIHPQQSVQNVKAEHIEKITLEILRTHIDKGVPKIIADRALSLAYLRFAYWYILAGKSVAAREKLRISQEYSVDRVLDYRWHALYAASYLSDLAPGLVKNTLGSFH
jgi:glycosyltransferase involved in cell wall biosynthesis